MKRFFIFSTALVFLGCANHTFSISEKDNLIKELEYIRKIDQEFAGVPSTEMKEKYGIEKAWDIFEKKRDSVSVDNQEKIKEMTSNYGFLGKDKVGNHSSTIWLVVQHADNDVDFQKKMLKIFKKELRKNNISKSNYAYLEDRIASNTGNKQRFGTQVEYNKKGQAVPKNGLIDSLKVDQYRIDFDMDSLKIYYNEMTQMHFEMNKENFLKQGIQEAQLYR